MKRKPIDLGRPVYEICKTYPEIVAILAELGFQDIVKPGMLQTAGRFMTIPKGAQMRHIELEAVKAKLCEKGFDPE